MFNKLFDTINRKMAKKRFLALAGIIILAVLLSRFNVSKIIALMLDIDPFFLLATMPLVFLAITLKSAKWNMALAYSGVKIPFGNAFRLYCVGFFLSVATPARIGDFAKAIYLKKQAPLAKTIATIFFDRLFDVLLLVATGLLGLALFAAFFHNSLLPRGMDCRVRGTCNRRPRCVPQARGFAAGFQAFFPADSSRILSKWSITAIQGIL